MFYIIVIAGELKDADNKVLRVIADIEIQKLFWTRQQIAVKTNARKLLTMQIFAFAVGFSFVSRRSLNMPLTKFDPNPPKASEIALIIAYYVL